MLRIYESCSLPACVLFVFAGLIAMPTILVAAAKEPLDQALEALHMSRSDLSLDVNDRRRDAFAITDVDRLMTEPLATPDYAQGLAEKLLATKKLKVLVGHMAERLDAEAKPAESFEPPTYSLALRQKLRLLPEKLALEVQALYAAAFEANQQFARAYANLTPEQVEILTTKSDIGDRRSYPLYQYFVRHHRGSENVEEADEELLAAAAAFDLDAVFGAAVTWAEAVEDAKKSIKRWVEQLNEVPEGVLFDVTTELGRILVLGSGDEIVTEPAHIVIDLGGDDTYLAPIAGGEKCSAAIELSGNDRYSPQADYALAAGIHGVAVMFDCEGNDVYETHDIALGVGLFGVGIMVDEKGRDEYDTQEVTCGTAALGIGALIDLEGNDSYYVRRMGQAASVTRGFGLLLDRKGNDAYFAGRRYSGWSTSRKFSVSAAQGFAGGIRQYTSGAVAMLLDVEGDDTYRGSAIAQGVGYWYAVGLLVDAAGNDRYYARHYGQGNAFHYAVGALLDNAGHDIYIGQVTTQGSGYDYAAGLLVDYAGNDIYKSDHLSAGSGGVTGIGLLLDNAGDDHYLVGRKRSFSMGGGQANRGLGSIGVFIDHRGKDYYMHPPAGENSLWTRREFGVGLDLENSKPTFSKRMKLPRLPRKPPVWKPQPKKVVKNDDDEELTRVEKAVRTLENRKSTEDERVAALAIVRSNFEEAQPLLIKGILAKPFYKSFGSAYGVVPEMGTPILPALFDVLDTGDVEDQVRAIEMMGEIKSASAPMYLKAALKHPNYRIRAEAADSLGDLGQEDAVDDIVALLDGEQHLERWSAAKALGKLKVASSGPALVAALNDPHYSVRNMASKALVRLKDAAGPPIREAMKTNRNLVLQCRLLEVLALATKTGAQREIEAGLSSKYWLIRAAACRSALYAEVGDLLPKLEQLAESDAHSNVRQMAGQTVEILSKLK